MTSDLRKIRIVVSGAGGRMGREVVRAIAGTEDCILVGATGGRGAGIDAGSAAGISPLGVPIVSGFGNELNELLSTVEADVLIEFSLPAAAMANIRVALAKGVCPVIGTTGLTGADFAEIDRAAREKGIGALFAPNFAIGAVLLMQFATQAAKYLPDAEIIEMHHEKKLDSPSGTALLTAQMIAQARREADVYPLSSPDGVIEKAAGARGACEEATGDVRVHSIRLPGFVASQEVIFGGVGQTLTLRHDSLDRSSFMPGVLLAVRKVRSLHGFVIGLENLL